MNNYNKLKKKLLVDSKVRKEYMKEWYKDCIAALGPAFNNYYMLIEKEALRKFAKKYYTKDDPIHGLINEFIK